MSSNYERFAFVILGAIVAACTMANNIADGSKMMRLLWLGSSSTHYHDAPRDVAGGSRGRTTILPPDPS